MAAVEEEWADLSFFQTLFDQASDGYIVLDNQLKVRYLNQTSKEWFGYPIKLNEITCSHLLQCDLSESDAIDEKCLGCKVLLNRASINAEQFNVRKQDGKTLPVSISYSYISWHNHESFVLMALRDISLQKKLEQERIMKDALHYTVEERERIARDLHDTVAQDLAYTGLRLKQLRREWAKTNAVPSPSVVEELSSISQVIDRSIKELRNSLYDLNFELETDFFEFIREHAIQLELRSGIKTEVDIHDTGSAWADRVEVQLARMAKEVLTNIQKHSHSRYVRLWFNRTPQEMRIVISDDGIGFNPKIAQEDPRHYGIKSIEERCRILGGTANVDSQPGQGTTWKFHIPAHYEAKHNIPQATPTRSIQ